MDEGGGRFLAVRLSSLGDVVLTTPVFDNIKRARPNSRVSVLVKEAFADVLRGHPSVDEVLVFEERGLWGWAAEVRRRRFDVLIDLHDTWRSRVWSLFSGARVVRYDKRAWERRRLVRTKEASPRLAGRVTDRYLECLETLGIPAAVRAPRLSPETGPSPLPGPAAEPFIGVVPGAAHATKRWPPERFAAAAEALRSRWGGTVVLLGAGGDVPAARVVAERLKGPCIDLSGRTSLREMVQVLARCRAVLTNDSGAMHAAAALGVPTVAVFGPTVEAFGFFPSGPRAAVVQLDGLECRPCHLHGLAACPLGHFKCMNDLPAERVVEEALRLVR